MSRWNVEVFHWIAAIHEGATWVLPLARVAALYGAGLVAALVTWSLLRFPAERRHVLGALVACALATLLAHRIAAALGVPRPFAAGLSPLYIPHSQTGSLPSAHAAVMMLVALLYLLRDTLRPLGVAMATMAVATGIGRVFVGVHFPVDIAAGYLLAALMAGAWWGIDSGVRHRRQVESRLRFHVLARHPEARRVPEPDQGLHPLSGTPVGVDGLIND